MSTVQILLGFSLISLTCVVFGIVIFKNIKDLCLFSIYIVSKYTKGI